MVGRILTEKQQAEFFQMLGDVNNLDARVISSLFAVSKKDGIKFHVDDYITIGPSESKFVKPKTVTTLGIYIWNKYLIEPLGIFGYINRTADASFNDKIDSAMSKALMDSDLTWEQYSTYIDRCQWLYGGPLAMIINPSLSQTLLSLPPKATALRKQLLEENKEALATNDPQVAVKIEGAVVKQALEEMNATGDPAMDIINSGCGISASNQYKTIFVMKGAIADNTGESPTGYKIITSNYDTGISKDDASKIADAVVTSSYSSGVATQDSGFNAKKWNSQLQRVRIQAKGSDCKTKECLKTLVTPENAESLIYRYHMVNGRPTRINRDNVTSLIGKTIDLRTGIHCKAKDPEYCNCCVGDRPYRRGVRNVGFFFMTISGSTLNASLKKKHDVSIKMYNVKVDDVLKYVS